MPIVDCRSVVLKFEPIILCTYSPDVDLPWSLICDTFLIIFLSPDDTQPPSIVVICFAMWKLKTDVWSKDPILLFLYSEPNASAASSIRVNL